MSDELTAPVFDIKALMRRVDNDTNLIAELIRLFKVEYPASKNRIIQALDKGDATEIERGAHAIKSALGNLGAMRCSDVALRLEKLGRSKKIEEAPALWRELESEVSSFLAQAEKELEHIT